MRTTFTSAELAEARELLTGLPTDRLAVQRMSVARLRLMGMPLGNAALPTSADLDALLARGEIRTDDDGLARVDVSSRPAQVFRVAVGTTQKPVAADWSAFAP